MYRKHKGGGETWFRLYPFWLTVNEGANPTFALGWLMGDRFFWYISINGWRRHRGRR
jgi:hypothetical protein